MLKTNLILNLPGFVIEKVSGYQPLVLNIRDKRIASCANCNSKQVRKKSSLIRRVHHELIGHRRTVLVFIAYMLYCHNVMIASIMVTSRFPGYINTNVQLGACKQL